MLTQSYSNGGSTVLNNGGTLTSGATSFTVASGAVFPAVTTGVSAFDLIIESEIMRCTNISGNVLTVLRGQEGTTAVSHADGLAVNEIVTAQGIKNFGSIVHASDVGANKPAAGNVGRLWLPQDGYQIEQEDGTNWRAWGPLYPFVEPIPGNFSWFNQTSNSVSGVLTTSQGGMVIKAPGQAGGEAPRVQELALSGASTWTYTAAFIPQGYPRNFWNSGLMLRDSVSTKAARFGCGFSTTFDLSVTYYSSTTLFNSFYTDLNTSGNADAKLSDLGALPLFFQIVNDNTNWFFNFSRDGQNFINFCKVAKNTNLTPDRIGFYANSDDANHDTFITLLSWTGP